MCLRWDQYYKVQDGRTGCNIIQTKACLHTLHIVFFLLCSLITIRGLWIHHYWPSACLKTTEADRRRRSRVYIYTTLWGTTRHKSPVNANGSGAETTCTSTRAHSPTLARVSLAQNSSCVCRGISVCLGTRTQQNKPKSKQTPVKSGSKTLCFALTPVGIRVYAPLEHGELWRN